MTNRNGLIKHVGVIQHCIMDSDIKANLALIEESLERIKPPTDSLIVLPELWACGFVYDNFANLSNDINSLEGALQKLAQKYHVLLAGSLPEKIDAKEGRYYNSVKIVDTIQSYGLYRKRHLFPGEEIVFEQRKNGSELINTPHGSFGVMICYDLRFPDISRTLVQQGADMLLCCAQWPSDRIQHWRILNIARAIENQIFVVACNGIGKNNGIDLGGNSMIIGPDGTVLVELAGQSGAEVAEIDWQKMRKARAKFKSFAVATQLSSSEKIVSPQVCAENMVKRYRIGQKIALIRLKSTGDFDIHIEKIEKKHKECDFLVAGIEMVRQQKEHSRNECNNQHILQRYAALSAVDAVIDLTGISQAAERQLFNCCTFELF